MNKRDISPRERIRFAFKSSHCAGVRGVVFERMSLVRGSVRFFDAAKGYGFVTVDEGREKGKDAFVHASCVKGDPLRDGDDVEFYVEDDARKRGSLRATDVTGGTGRPERGGGGRDRDRDRDSGVSKGGGKGTQTKKPGDWDCSCGFMNFASRNDCMKCGKPKPRGARGGRDSRARSRSPERRKPKDSRARSARR